MNLFTWSIPFVSEKVLEVYSGIYQHLAKTEDTEEIKSEKFLQVMEDLKLDKDLEVKIQFIEN